MADNRRRNAHTVPIVKFLIIVVIGVTVCAAGLRYILCLNDLNVIGEKIKKCEAEREWLRIRNEGIKTSIETFGSAAQLEMDLKKGRFKKLNLERIGDLARQDYATIVKMPHPSRPGAGEFRAVVNDAKRK